MRLEQIETGSGHRRSARAVDHDRHASLELPEIARRRGIRAKQPALAARSAARRLRRRRPESQDLSEEELRPGRRRRRLRIDRPVPRSGRPRSSPSHRRRQASPPLRSRASRECRPPDRAGRVIRSANPPAAFNTPRHASHLGTEPLVSRQAQGAGAAALEQREGDPSPDPATVGCVRCLHDAAHRLVAEDERQLRPVRRSFEDVKVGSADPACLDLHEQLVRRRLRRRDIDDRERGRRELLDDRGSHARPSGTEGLTVHADEVSIAVEAGPDAGAGRGPAEHVPGKRDVAGPRIVRPDRLRRALPRRAGSEAPTSCSRCRPGARD